VRHLVTQAPFATLRSRTLISNHVSPFKSTRRWGERPNETDEIPLVRVCITQVAVRNDSGLLDALGCPDRSRKAKNVFQSSY